MLKIYKTNMETNELEEVNNFEKGCWINLVSPSEEEIATVCENINITDEFIRYPLDYEEKARIDVEDDMTLFVIDIPTIEKVNDERVYTTMPLGMIVVRDDFFITVSLNRNLVMEKFERNLVRSLYTYKKTRFILQIFFLNASYFLELLKKINKEAEVAQGKLQKSMKNKELITLLNLEKGLVYFTTSLRANEAVMEKTLKGKIIKLYDEDEDILEDAIVENKQAIEMVKIYSDILSGTMDAYASIISNNLNSVMKLLASVTIVLSLPTMIASFWGMNVKLPFAESNAGFGIIMMLSLGLAVVTTLILKKKDMF